MLSERTLRKWRKEALRLLRVEGNCAFNKEFVFEVHERILKLTQELLDQHLIRKIE